MKNWKTTVSDFYNTYLKFLGRDLSRAIDRFKGGSMQKNQGLLAPLIFIIAVLWTIVTIGLAFGSLLTFFCSLLVLYFIFTKIFGVNLDLSDVVIM